MATAGKAVSFVASIWLESEPNGDARWRGHVKHVQSGRDGFFDDLGALGAFVEGVSGLSGSALRARHRRGPSLPNAARPSRKRALRRLNKKHGA